MGVMASTRATSMVGSVCAILGLLGLVATPLVIWALGEWWPRAMLGMLVLGALVYSVGRVLD